MVEPAPDPTLKALKELHEIARLQAETIELLAAGVLALSIRVGLLEKGE